jgi:NH3-dependent NAD+ synthetase
MNDLSGKHIVLGLSGGIACYKAAELCRALIKEGATVQVVMTGRPSSSSRRDHAGAEQPHRVHLAVGRA